MLLLAAAAATAFTIGACGSDDPETPQVDDIPAGAVALVGDEPVTKAELRRRIGALRRGQRKAGAATPSLRQQALTLLLQEAALEQEAAALEVTVPEAQIRKRVDQARRQFKNERQFRRFLGGQTEADLIAQLRMQALTEQVAEKDGAGDSNASALEALRREWRERTVCRESYRVSACGNPKSASG